MNVTVLPSVKLSKPQRLKTQISLLVVHFMICELSLCSHLTQRLNGTVVFSWQHSQDLVTETSLQYCRGAQTALSKDYLLVCLTDLMQD